MRDFDTYLAIQFVGKNIFFHWNRWDDSKYIHKDFDFYSVLKVLEQFSKSLLCCYGMKMDGSMARVKQRSGLISKIHWTPLRWPWTKHLRCGPECLFQCPNGALNELKTLNSRKLFSRDCLSLEPHKSHCRFPWCLTSERAGQSWVAWPEALECHQAHDIHGLPWKISKHEMPPATLLFKAQL